jgi:hypothetical protein
LISAPTNHARIDAANLPAQAFRRMAKKSRVESAAKTPSNKVIVAKTVQEILDEHIAKKLV